MSDSNFVDNKADIAETNIDASREDRLAEESEATGKISKALDDSEGYTRSSNKDANPLKAEQDVDAAVDNLE
ncbi:hypothetical protein CI109_103152 [Kwoniella shandongensis]|uniref:Uncharacterized protein n=1 Tax=Kwoniella shandongensis TaxID=1734106 RepID=A0AAJ8MWW4_9TREE